MAKALVTCPKCKNRTQTTRPDSEHPFWSTGKPSKDEEITNYIEQVIECKNQNCANKFNVYWFDK
jgi:hypothetical protein